MQNQKRQAIKASAQEYYKNKKMWWRLVIIVLLIFLWLLQIIGITPEKTSYTKIDYGTLSFAGEEIPLGGQYFFNQEKFDRELAITQLNTAQFVMIHRRENRYLPYIEEQLKQANIPTDFKYLVVAESYLRNDARSTAWAGGLWQFMEATAEHRWLLVNNMIDERFHLEKATKSAIDYIWDLYEDFNDRTLVAAAYNRGENGLKRDMQWQNKTWYYDLRLNSETSRYIFRIVAIKYLMEHRYDYFDVSVLGQQYEIPKTKTIRVSQIDDIATWASDEGYSYTQIRQLNPRIRVNELPQGKREIRVFK